jgi:toxin YoeB
MHNLVFTADAWEDYLYWQTQDKKVLNRIHLLIKDIARNGYDGIGKPEPLVGNHSGCHSRRIDEKNRMIYRLNGGAIEIYALRTHYDKK